MVLGTRPPRTRGPVGQPWNCSGIAQLHGGLPNAEIATVLHLSEATVKTHVGRILAKLQLRDRSQAIVIAYESGLIQPGATSVVDRRDPR